MISRVRWMCLRFVHTSCMNVKMCAEVRVLLTWLRYDRADVDFTEIRHNAEEVMTIVCVLLLAWGRLDSSRLRLPPGMPSVEVDEITIMAGKTSHVSKSMEKLSHEAFLRWLTEAVLTHESPETVWRRILPYCFAACCIECSHSPVRPCYVQSGAKFGTETALYFGDPDVYHSAYSVIVIHEFAPWRLLVGRTRLANSVFKKVLVLIDSVDAVRVIALERPHF